MKRRSLLASAQAGSLVLLLGRAQIAWGASILAVRIWPAPDYSRVTIESDSRLTAQSQFVPTPPRLAVDIEGIELNPALKELVAKVQSDDPNIAGIRVGQFAPGIVRLVVDLKLPIAPQVFSLPPVAAYQHRLVLDLYPAQATDPLAALIADRLKDQQLTDSARQASNQGLAAATGSAAVPTKPVADPLGDLIAQSTRRPAAAGPLAPASATQIAIKKEANNAIISSTNKPFQARA